MMLNSNDEFETHMSTLQKLEAYDWWNNPEKCLKILPWFWITKAHTRASIVEKPRKT